MIMVYISDNANTNGGRVLVISRLLLQAPRKNFLSLAFKGKDMNTSGIGAKTYLFQKGKLQYGQLMLTRGFQSSSDSRLHFGLDTVTALIEF